MWTELAGFFAEVIMLLAVDVFTELVMFERLEWNGTTKIDWFLRCGGSCVVMDYEQREAFVARPESLQSAELKPTAK